MARPTPGCSISAAEAADGAVEVRDQSGTFANFLARIDLTIDPVGQQVQTQRAFSAGRYLHLTTWPTGWISPPPWYMLTVR